MIAMSINWYTSLTILIPVIFFFEILIAIRIFRKRRKRSQSASPHNQVILVVLNQNPTPSHQTANPAITTPPYQITQVALPTTNKPSKKGDKMRFIQGLCLSGIFLFVFIIINYLLRPYTYAWTLIFLPILFPLPFLIFPSLFNLRSLATFGCLLIGLSLGAFTLFLL